MWLRPSYTPPRAHDRVRLAAPRRAARPASTSSSTPASCCPAAAPTRPTRPASSASTPTCARCSSTSRDGWARWAGPTPSSRATGTARGMNVADGHAAPAPAPGRQRAPAPPARPGARRARPLGALPHLRPRGRSRADVVLRAPPVAAAARHARCPRPWRRRRPGEGRGPCRARRRRARPLQHLDEPGRGAAGRARRQPYVLTHYGTEIWHHDGRDARFRRFNREAPTSSFYSRRSWSGRASWRSRCAAASVVYPPVADAFHPLAAGAARGGPPAACASRRGRCS